MTLRVNQLKQDKPQFLTCSSYLKDASKGPGAQMVQYGVTIDDFKGRSVLVHSIDAFSQTVQFVFLQYKTHICKVRNNQFYLYLFIFLFISLPQKKKQLNKHLEAALLQCRMKLWFAAPRRPRGPVRNVQHQ